MHFSKIKNYLVTQFSYLSWFLTDELFYSPSFLAWKSYIMHHFPRDLWDYIFVLLVNSIDNSLNLLERLRYLLVDQVLMIRWFIKRVFKVEYFYNLRYIPWYKTIHFSILYRITYITKKMKLLKSQWKDKSTRIIKIVGFPFLCEL